MEEEDKNLIEYDASFSDYMERIFKDIKNIDKRNFTNIYIKNAFEKIIEITQEKYEILEKSIYDEFKLLDNKYGINMTLTKKEDFSYTNDTFFPMCIEDLRKKFTNLDNVINNQDYLKTIFFEGTEKDIQNIKNKVIEGKIFTLYGDFDCTFKIVKSKRYFEKVINLYELFNYNYILWTTVNTAFIDRFFDIVIEDIENENLDIDLENCIIQDIALDFNSLKLDISKIKEDLIPIWNIEEIKISSSEFMKPFIDEKYYEHNIDLKEFGLENGYLLNINDNILSLKFEEDKIIIKSNIEIFEDWVIYKIVNKTPIKSLGYTYDMLDNRKKQDFSREYLNSNKISLKTELDYIRKINELSIEKYVKYDGYEILSREYINKFQLLENDMNYFVKEGIFAYDDRKILLFKFKILQKDCFFSDSIIRFIISQLQLDESEYTCIGIASDYEISKLVK